MSVKTFNLLCAALAVVVPFAAYVVTLAPGVVFSDAGELMTAAAALGTGHPPGYPVAALVGQLLTLLPFGAIAWRVNLASAVAAAATAGLLFFFLRGIFTAAAPAARPAAALAALAAAWAFAFGRTFWGQAVITEVYTTSALCVAAALYAAGRLWLSGDARWGYAAAFAGGLAVAAHFSSLLVLVPVAAYSWVRLGRAPGWRAVGVAGALALLGASLYLYLPVRAMQTPAVNWGETRDVPALAAHLLRRGMGGANVARWYFLPRHLLELAAQTWREATPALPVLAVAGAVAAWRGRARPFGFLAVLAACVGPLATALLVLTLRGDQATEIGVWYTPFFMAAASFAGFGIFTALTSARRWAQGAGYAAAAAAAVLPLVVNFAWNDYRGYYYAEDYAGNEIRSTVYGAALVLVADDNGVFETMPGLKVERRRPDLEVLSSVLGLFPGRDWPARARELTAREHNPAAVEGAFEMLALTLVPTRPVYVMNVRGGPAACGYGVRQEGLLYRVMAAGDEPAAAGIPAVWKRYPTRGFAALEARPASPRARGDVWLRFFTCNYLIREACQYLNAGRRAEGLALARRAESLAYGLFEPLANLAAIQLAQGDPAAAAVLFDRAAKAVPRAGVGDDVIRYYYAGILAKKAEAYDRAGNAAAAATARAEATTAYGGGETQ